MTNEQIDDFLAEKVMGWHKEAIEGYQPYWEDAQGKMQITCDEWQPATDLNQAAQAAEKVADGQNEIWELNYWPMAGDRYHKYKARFGDAHILSDSPADALARAVVKAAGGDDGN